MSSTESIPQAPHAGTIVSVRGSVVDARFEDHLPASQTVLTSDHARVLVEVLTHLDAQHVRAIALTSTQGLARGTPMLDTGGPLIQMADSALLTLRPEAACVPQAATASATVDVAMPSQ